MSGVPYCNTGLTCCHGGDMSGVPICATKCASPAPPKKKGLSLLAKVGIAVVVGALLALLIYFIAVSAKHEKGGRKSGRKN